MKKPTKKQLLSFAAYFAIGFASWLLLRYLLICVMIWVTEYVIQ